MITMHQVKDTVTRLYELGFYIAIFYYPLNIEKSYSMNKEMLYYAGFERIHKSPMTYKNKMFEDYL